MRETKDRFPFPRPAELQYFRLRRHRAHFHWRFREQRTRRTAVQNEQPGTAARAV